jgi:hypothetical protein
MPRPPLLTPESQFPAEALKQSVQKAPDASSFPASTVFTWQIATVADSITPWGRNVRLRDRQLRDFWVTESFLAGALTNVSYRNAAFPWEIRGASQNVEKAVTDILTSAISGDSFGWTNFVLKFSQDLYCQDNGAFVELIRDPGMDANSKFKEDRAPVLGIAHMDSNQCTRTGDPKFPVIYTDRSVKDHKLAWYQVIPFSDYPSAIEKMNGVGICAVSRSLRLAQIMRSIFIFKDEKISGRHYKALHMVSGVSRQDLADILKRGKEEADNMGQIRYIDPAILASLDPEKPVSTATIDLASLPDGFDFDAELKWYISGLALCFGVDYQEFAPLPGGGIGSSNQSETLNVKTSGKGPAMFMKIAEAFKNYGVLPRGYEMIFEDLDQQRALDKQTLQKLFQEEMALGLRNGFLTPDAARKIGIARGIYPESELADIPQGYGEDLLLPKQTIGNTGGNTIAEDAGRTPSGVTEPNAGARLRKEADEDEEKTTLRSIIGKLLGRKEKDAPSVNLTVNNHPGEPAKVEVHPTAMAIPAPLVNVQAGVIPAPQVTLNLAKQATPNVTVNNLVPAPKVEVNIPRKRKEKQRVLRGSDKNIEGTETTFEYEE